MTVDAPVADAGQTAKNSLMEIRELNQEEASARDGGVALAAEYLASNPPFSPRQVQALYDAILEHDPEHEEAQIALGIVFGEMIAAKAGYRWMRIIDEYGAETGLCHGAALVTCFPISMLQKRISRREAIDLVELRDATIATVEETANGAERSAI